MMVETERKRVGLENSRPVVALIRFLGWVTSAPSRRQARA